MYSVALAVEEERQIYDFFVGGRDMCLAKCINPFSQEGLVAAASFLYFFSSSVCISGFDWIRNSF